MTGLYENTCRYTKKNVVEMQKAMHRNTAKQSMLLSLAGAAILIAGVVFAKGSLIYFGTFWLLFFLLYMRNHLARKAAKQILKHYKDVYGVEAETTLTFLGGSVIAHNDTSGAESRTEYDDVERVIATRNLYILVLPDSVAVMVDRRELGEEHDTELYRFLRDKCRGAEFIG